MALAIYKVLRTLIIIVFVPSLLRVRGARSFLPPDSPLGDAFARSIVENNAGHWKILLPFEKCILSL